MSEPHGHTEATLSAAIRATYGSLNGTPRYVCAFQVNNGAGFGFGRTLDAIVFDTWPSKGLRLDGFEVKISASDFRRELQDTAKFAEFAPLLDTFSILAPKGVIDRELVPKAWGIYQPTDDGKIRAVRKPLMLHTDGNRETVDRSLMAAFSRALLQRSLSLEAEQDAFAAGEEIGRKRAELEVKTATDRATSLKFAIDRFQEQTGVDIGHYYGPDHAAKAFLAFLKLSGRGYMGGLPLTQARHMLASLEELTSELEALNAFLGGPA